MHLVLTRPPGLPTPFTKPSSRPKEAAGWLARSPRSPPRWVATKASSLQESPQPCGGGRARGGGGAEGVAARPGGPSCRSISAAATKLPPPIQTHSPPGPVGASVKDPQEGGVSPLDAQGTGQKASGTADREGPVSVGGEAPRRRSAPRGAAVRMKRGTGVLRGALCSCSLPLPRGLHTRQRAPVASATRA